MKNFPIFNLESVVGIFQLGKCSWNFPTWKGLEGFHSICTTLLRTSKLKIRLPNLEHFHFQLIFSNYNFHLYANLATVFDRFATAQRLSSNLTQQLSRFKTEIGTTIVN